MEDDLETAWLGRVERERAPAVFAHEARVGRIAGALARAMGLETDHVAVIERAAALHDIGKMLIPPSILDKPGRLTDEEAAILRTHPSLGHRMLAGGGGARALAATLALQHHEAWDGSGYPQGLAGTAIAPEARLVALADIYDALREHRAYKRALPHGEAVSMILAGRGRTRPDLFDPDMLTVIARNPALLDRAFGGP